MATFLTHEFDGRNGGRFPFKVAVRPQTAVVTVAVGSLYTDEATIFIERTPEAVEVVAAEFEQAAHTLRALFSPSVSVFVWHESLGVAATHKNVMPHCSLCVENRRQFEAALATVAAL